MTSFKHEQKNDDEVNFAGGLCLRYVKKIVSISILNRLEAKLYIPRNHKHLTVAQHSHLGR